jgi:hypothetical protein
MERVSRRKLLAAASSGAAVASTLIGAGTAAAQVRPTEPPGLGKLEPWLERVQVVINAQGSDALRQPASQGQAPTGPFYWTGTLWEDGAVGTDGRPAADAKQVGLYRAYGWVYVPGVTPQFTAVHTLDFFGRGQVIASGTTDISVAVTGGTGTFQSARGEIRAATIGTTGLAYTLELELVSPTVGR